MKRHVWLLIGGLVAVVGLAVWFFFRPGPGRLAVDLLKEFPAATKQPNAQAFVLIDAKLGNETKPSIFASEPGRITWHLTVPDNAWLKVSVGLKEEAWTQKGDGVYFFVAVSDGGPHYDVLVSLVVNPYANPSERGWRDLMLDLSQYAGSTVDLFFNTRSSPPPTPGTAPHDDRNGDLALWGDPQIVVR
jgi:hypothetical protein